jgi:acyl carrier protein
MTDTDTGALEAQVITLMRDVLQVEVEGSGDDLLESGLLDSLAVVSLIGELELALGFELPLDDFDLENFRTVERIAGFLATAQRGQGAA